MENKSTFGIKDILMILIIIAIVILFILVLKQNHQNASALSNQTESNNSSQSRNTNTSTLPQTRIAFVNIDTLNEKYLYIADYVKIMKKRKETIEAQLQAMMTQFQQDYENFQQSVQAGIAPQAELEKQKRKLEQQQKDIQNKQLQMDNLAIELQEKNEQLQRDIKEFMKRFNNGRYDYILSYSEALPNVLLANPQYDITQEVLNALNKEYLQKKEKK